MSNQNIYKLPNQEVEKSIIYEIPRGPTSTFGKYIEPQNQIKYKVR